MKKIILCLTIILCLMSNISLANSINEDSYLINDIGKGILAANHLPEARFVITDRPDTFDDYFVIANVYKRVEMFTWELSFADDKGLSDVALQKKGNIDRKAFSKLRCGTTKKPSKSTAMALAIALELNLDETKDLLSRAGYALSPCSKQDLIVQFFIENEAYDIYELNEVLTQYGEPELGVRL